LQRQQEFGHLLEALDLSHADPATFRGEGELLAGSRGLALSGMGLGPFDLFLVSDLGHDGFPMLAGETGGQPRRAPPVLE
jgi:hypothetical protein